MINDLTPFNKFWLVMLIIALIIWGIWISYQYFKERKNKTEDKTYFCMLLGEVCDKRCPHYGYKEENGCGNRCQ